MPYENTFSIFPPENKDGLHFSKNPQSLSIDLASVIQGEKGEKGDPGTPGEGADLDTDYALIYEIAKL